MIAQLALALVGRGEIAVNPGGSGTLTFDTLPAITEWATYALPGGNNTYDDTSVSAFDSAIIALADVGTTGFVALDSQAGYNATGGKAHWNSAAKTIYTGPTSAAGTLLLAKLTNNSGGTLTGLSITYDVFNNGWDSTPLQGQRVYFSQTGAAGSWQLIPALSGLTNGVALAASLSLVSWPQGGELYILWADDNAAIGLDPCYAIDNLSFLPLPFQPVTITSEPPASVEVLEGGTTNWTVGADGTAPRYQWYHGVALIPWATGATLVLTNVQLSDAGDYWCAITNAVSATSSAMVTLTVDWRPLRITNQPPATVTVNAGATTSWSVGVDGTAPCYQWYHDATPIPWGTSATLTITNARTGDAGTYSCGITNAVSSTNSLATTVTVIPSSGHEGKVCFVIGADTAIWNYPVNGPTTVDAYTRHPHYKQDVFTDPSQPSYKVMDPALRNRFKDSYDRPVVFTWWMMGGNIYRDADNLNVPLANTMCLYLMKKYHGEAIRQLGDELSLHYHTFFWSDVNLDGKFYWNQPCDFAPCRADFDVTLAQYLLEENLFPASFRSGWHFMDNDWQAYLNQLLPFCLHNDYGVSRGCYTNAEPVGGIEDWSRAPSAFVPFHPATNNYQVPGEGVGWNGRSIKMQNLTQAVINQVFARAAAGTNQVVCIWNHPAENFLGYLTNTLGFIQTAASNNPAVPFRYCTAVDAMQQWLGATNQTPLELRVEEQLQEQTLTLVIETSGPIFQPQPFVAMRDAFQQYSVVACTAIGSNSWAVTLPTPRNLLAKVGLAVTDPAGNVTTRILRYLPDDLYVDNLDPGYAELLGNWTSTTTAAWGTNARIARLASSDTAQVRWSLPIARSGRYDLSVQVPPIANSASNVLFTVYAGETSLYSYWFPLPVPTNQWADLGAVLLDQTLSNSLEMMVWGSNQPNAYAVADVVRIIPLPDTNAPILICPSDIVTGCAGPNGAVVTFAPTASDTDDPYPVVTCQPPSGTLFPIGTTPVLCTATDASGNSSSCGFSVTVQAAEPPVIVSVTNAVLVADSSCLALLPDLTGTDYLAVADNCGSVTVTQSVAAGTALAVGQHEVVLAAVDAAGNTAYGTNHVLVVDEGPPAIAQQPVGLTNLLGTDAAFQVTATSCGPMSCQWWQGLRSLDGQTNLTLVLTHVQLSDAGDYSVILANSAGSVTSAVAVLTVNQAPVAFARGLATTKDQPVSITVADFVAPDFDPDHDALTLTVSPSSSQGGTVRVADGLMTYRPEAGFVGLDSFNYTLDDGRGGTASAAVQVLVASCCLPSFHQVTLVRTAKGFQVRFAGEPGLRCEVQRSPVLDPPDWTTLDTQEIPLPGILEYEDTNAPPTAAYYRIVGEQPTLPAKSSAR